MTASAISVCTLARGRDEHLANLVRGLAHSTLPPVELVIAVLQARPYALPAAPFPVRQLVLGDGELALARARNIAARAAAGDLLVFLDVDCIPDPACLADYAAAAANGTAAGGAADGVFMGEVGYLPKGAAAAGLDFARFAATAVRHSERQGPPEAARKACRDYRCFWSLNFALSPAAFAAIGGFDEGYAGYGGEDTDFGRLIDAAGLPLWWIRGGRAYHQYHPHHMPPVHHIDSVIANSAYFARKWGTPTMQHWLRAFTLMGLTRPGPHGWTKLREPDADDLALTRQQEHEPYASSALVLDWLETRAAAQAAGTPAPPFPRPPA